MYNAREQVIYLKERKSVAFDLISEEAAAEFLASRNYFFKLKAFAKNYEKRFKDDDRKGAYIGLDFAHLVELSRLDKSLRDLILKLTLDIEHNLKVRINRAAMDARVDPRILAESYLDRSSRNALMDQASKTTIDEAEAAFKTLQTELALICGFESSADAVAAANKLMAIVESVTKGRDPDHVRKSYAAMATSPYSKGIVEKYGDRDMPYWCLMELISFGPLINLYKACFGKDGLIEDDEERRVLKSIKNILRRVQVLRNAAAHGDCLMNGLRDYTKSRSSTGVRKALEGSGICGAEVDHVSSVPLAMDLAAVLICYDIIVPCGKSKESVALELDRFVDRCGLHYDWFGKNYAIRSFLDYLKYVLPAFSDRYRRA